MIPWGCNIHYHSDRYFDIRTVAYLQTVRLILQVFSSSINSLKIEATKGPLDVRRLNNTMAFVTSRQIPISMIDIHIYIKIV